MCCRNVCFYPQQSGSVKHINFPCLKILFLPSLNDLHCKVPLNLESLNQTEVTSLVGRRLLTSVAVHLTIHCNTMNNNGKKGHQVKVSCSLFTPFKIKRIFAWQSYLLSPLSSDCFDLRKKLTTAVIADEPDGQVDIDLSITIRWRNLNIN